jgi:hypothetical protein
MDRDLATRLVNELEKVVLENQILKSILMGYGDALRIPWREHLEALMADPEVTATTHRQFAQLRDQVQSDSDLAEGIRRLLEVFPANKQVN